MVTGVLGAASMVGDSLLPLLADAGCRVVAYSRQERPSGDPGRIEFRMPILDGGNGPDDEIADWISLAPIWVLPEHFAMLERHHAKRIVVLSSTSVFAKQHSSDPAEREVARSLAQGERQLIAWAETNGIQWVILRPTLIYGNGRDRNLCVIARFIARFGFFPVFGRAQGMRQPVHAEDVATACVAALLNLHVSDHAYNISGAERLSYRAMVGRIFAAMGRPVRLVGIPLSLFRIAVAVLRILPHFRSWSPAMAERMNTDLIFDHTEASRDFGFAPRPFRLDKKDLPFV